MLPSEIQKLPTDPSVRVLPGVRKLSSFKTPFLGQISIPTSFVSLSIFYILSYLLLKTMGCLSGCLMSSSSIQKLFCGICSAFKCSFNEFVGEKVASLSYSSTILGLPWPYSEFSIWENSLNLQYWPLVSWTEHICFLSCQDPLEYVILYDVITRWLFSSWG